MVRGLAYLVLALITVAMTVVYFTGERARLFADVDRRLALLAPADAVPARGARPLSLPVRIAPLLAQAQLEITTHTLRLLVGVGLALAVLALLVAGPLATLAVLVGLPMLALAWVRQRARKRVDQLIEALPHYIDAVRQLQAVGNSLSQALERGLADAPDIVKSFFAPAARRLEMGAPVGDTMQQLADRLQIPEVSMLAAAIKTNLRYGGSISAVLRNLAHILRERVRVKWELQAATSEAKVSSRVLIAMPLLAMALLMMMNPGYILFFINDPRGQTLAMVALGLEALGILVLRRVLRLDF
ncbi:type II secretion system F family protein [Novosphingobium album (ex Liu et al. 2023)]|uniref:Type II secretion system F family protein n=1 Tax=Novosphingobium album (ex Liu et al. 2023) TaxID=3031130 RepID=A0ABT5WMJ1_9SPHN|nr:type II secretion system F family protein [Novosphingobium album (ex Liu et al. 2023)]MDE8650502.1 type II secretion system F family protein [Novosphingobium album (ex Liu et al. 2023)]